MDIKITGILAGEVTPPPSKSQAHRLLIGAALSDATCTIHCNAINDDMKATMNSLNALGANIIYDNDKFIVNPIKLKKGGTLDCGESGSTLRFLLSVATVLGADATFIGSGKLPYRPNSALCDVLANHGITFERKNPTAELPVTCKGRLHGGNYILPGNISSQYLTGLLFALPLAQEDSEIEITDGLSSASYISMTLDVLHTAGIKIDAKKEKYNIPGKQHYSLPKELVIESDWSAAAFWIVAGIIGKNPITIHRTTPMSLQGDRHIVEHLRKMGAFIKISNEEITAIPSQLFATELDCKDTPDLVPILAVAASVATGKTTFTNVGRLRFKECDRLLAIERMLASFGISSETGDDTLTVFGGGKAIAKTPVDSFNDHRIAMSAAILSTIAEGETIINNAECVAKSYPRFYEDFIALGGKTEEIQTIKSAKN